MKLLKLEVSVSSNLEEQFKPIYNSKYCVGHINLSRFELKDYFLIQDSRISLVKHLLHEIGHFIIVSKIRRRKVNFGYNDNVSKKTYIKYELEEIKATMIENELKRLFGFKYRKNLYDGSNVDKYFLKDNKNKVMQWWNKEGKIITQTYIDLV